uniref:Uncharacterized protein n=1 Tax=Caenorhabditis japonica TaxID=281687 RepID=A0A8R1IKD2_CAEJA
MERNPRKTSCTTVTTRNNCKLLSAPPLRPRIRPVDVHQRTIEETNARSKFEKDWNREADIIILANTTTETNGTGRK